MIDGGEHLDRRGREVTFLSIVIPAFNERSRLSKTIERALEWCSRSVPSYEIIIVDDGSADDTLAIAKSFSESSDHVVPFARPHLGKGATVKEGMLNAMGKFILFMDADGATPMEEIKKLLVKMKEGYPVAIGSRVVEDPRETILESSVHRKLIGRTSAAFVNFLTVGGIKDTQCGFKMFRGDAANTLFRLQLCNGFAFDVEILYLARKLSLSVAEVPVNWTNQSGSKVSLIADSFKMLKDNLKIRMMHRSWCLGPRVR
jgi:dolichyl-phosphate beta-glucosyltransferase